MIIIHKIDSLLEELFPGISKDSLSHELIEEKLKSFFKIASAEPKISFEGEYIKIELNQSFLKQEKEFNNAILYCEQGNYSKAKPILLDLIKQNPANSECHRILGQIHFDEQDFELAMNYLIDALRWNPKNTSALIMMGNTLVKHKRDIETALLYYKNIIEVNPTDYIALNNIGTNLIQTSNFDKAEEFFNKALEIKPDYPNLYLGLAFVYDSQKEHRKVFEYSVKALLNCDKLDRVYQTAFNFALKTAKEIGNYPVF